MGHDRAPLAAATGAKVESMIGRGDNVAVVLHHHDRVAKITKLAQCRDESVRVPWMEADRRLVEHIEHARQAAAHLRGQANPLQFAAGEAPRRPGHVEILKAHVDQKRHAGVEFPEQVTGDLLLISREHNGGNLLLQPR